MIADDTKETTPRVTVKQQIGSLIAVLVPFLGVLFAAYECWGWGFTWTELSLLLVMYVATGLGVTVGYHRLFTHRSFETVRPVKIALAILGSMAVEGPLLRWVATHRRHHQHSDRPDDPHSPHHYGVGVRAILAGWWHAHMGWIFRPLAPGLDRYVRDLAQDRGLRRISQTFGVWVVVGLLAPAIAGGVIAGTWWGVLLGFLWGGLVRVFVVHHVTWSINSVCHLWGSRPYATRDRSRNNLLFGVLGFGEGWHNNHHAFPTSARHGLRWWQFDTSYLFIRLLESLGLAWRVRVPAETRRSAV
ncbi:MAG: acyl-CoA desaturase [Planctomycetota bacterium]|nr:MAG: acyl-CoA desaturase [Planctomycetota bacterium]